MYAGNLELKINEQIISPETSDGSNHFDDRSNVDCCLEIAQKNNFPKQ